jgi:hypothetical protein
MVTSASRKSSARADSIVSKAAPKKVPAAAKPSGDKKVDAAPAATEVVAKPAKPVKQSQAAEKAKKPKMVRDSFTMPKGEYELIEVLKRRGLQGGVAVKKSEVLRAALKVLADLPAPAFKEALAAVPRLKTGRRPKDQK